MVWAGEHFVLLDPVDLMYPAGGAPVEFHSLANNVWKHFQVTRNQIAT